MSQPIDVAYVELIAKTQVFRKDLRDFIKNEIRDLEKAVDNTTKKIDKDFARTGRSVRRSLDDMVRDVGRGTRRMSLFFRQSFTRVRDIADQTWLRLRLGAALTFETIRNLGQKFITRLSPIGRGIGAFASDFTKAFGDIFGSITEFVSGLNFTAIGIGALILAIPGLIGLVFALAAALEPLLGLLFLIPSVLSTIVVAIAPVVLAFQNVGEAIGAAFGDDPKKFAEALDKLSPSARNFVASIQMFAPALKAMQKTVQESFFQPFWQSFAEAGTKIIPVLTSGLAGVASAVGQILDSFIKLFSSTEGIKTLNMIFNATSDVLGILKKAFDNTFGPIFLKFLQATLPVAVRLFEKFVGFLERFTQNISKSIEDGSLDRFFQDMFIALMKIGDLGKALAGLFDAIFTQSAVENGQTIIDKITDAITKLTNFLKTNEGKQFLNDLFTLAQATLNLAIGLTIVFGTLFVGITNILAIIADFLGLAERTDAKIQETAVIVANSTGDIIAAIASVPAQLVSLVPNFAAAGASLAASFVGGFKLPNNFLSNIAGDIFSSLKGNLNFVISKINSGIAALSFFLPGLTARIPSLAEGGVVPATPGGQIVRVGEGGQDEIVGPLDKVRDVLGGDQGGSGVVFEPGAIVINFHGVVPTEQEARQTGAAVAQGLTGAIARRDIRAQVRAR